MLIVFLSARQLVRAVGVVEGRELGNGPLQTLNNVTVDHLLFAGSRRNGDLVRARLA